MDMMIGLGVGLALAALGMWLLHRHHQKIEEKLIDSRVKLERQRTQAINDLFALRSEVENRPANVTGNLPVVTVPADTSTAPAPKVAAEVANLKNLLVRADAALATARRKRNEYEKEIQDLRTKLGQQDAQIITLHQDRSVVGG